MISGKHIQKVYSDYSSAEFRRLVYEYVDSGRTQKELAQFLGVSEHILRKMRDKVGIVLPPGRPVKKPTFKPEENVLDD